MGVRPLGFEVFYDQQELFNGSSNALFWVLQVWQDFIRFVVLRLLSRSTNFHKHIRNDAQDGLVSYEIHAHGVCFCFPLLISKRNYQFS